MFFKVVGVSRSYSSCGMEYVILEEGVSVYDQTWGRWPDQSSAGYLILLLLPVPAPANLVLLLLIPHIRRGVLVF